MKHNNYTRFKERVFLLTRFEKARIIGARSLQLSAGAPVLVKVAKSTMRLADVVAKELEEDVLPISVIRRMPDGSHSVFDMKGEKIGE
jgi:DNA-directed RNA polymerase subunit K/omega